MGNDLERLRNVPDMVNLFNDIPIIYEGKVVVGDEKLHFSKAEHQIRDEQDVSVAFHFPNLDEAMFILADGHGEIGESKKPVRSAVKNSIVRICERYLRLRMESNDTLKTLNDAIALEDSFLASEREGSNAGYFTQRWGYVFVGLIVTDNTVIVFNIGDAEGIEFGGDFPIRRSEIHNLDNVSEKSRLKDKLGFIKEETKQVFSRRSWLAVTRRMPSDKEQVVSAQPHVLSLNREKVRGKMIVMGTDGFYDWRHGFNVREIRKPGDVMKMAEQMASRGHDDVSYVTIGFFGDPSREEWRNE